MDILSYSEAGDGQCEDVQIHDPAPIDGLWRCVLADGMGGRTGALTAATVACETAWAELGRLNALERSSPASICGALVAADRAVAADIEAGFTTLIGLVLEDGWICGASCGDSQVLLVMDGTVSDLTNRQETKPPVGSGHADIRPFGAAVDAPWTLLIASDGVWKYVGTERLHRLLLAHRGQDLLDRALAAARLPGSGTLQDDFTLVIASSGEG